MAVTTESTLLAWTQWSLENHLHDNAAFLAERLVAETQSEESKLVLASCYYRSGATSRAAKVLEGCSKEPNRYMYALCLVKQGDISAAQRALLGPLAADPDASAPVANGAAGLYLMGMCCIKQSQRSRGIKCAAAPSLLSTASLFPAHCPHPCAGTSRARSRPTRSSGRPTRRSARLARRFPRS